MYKCILIFPIKNGDFPTFFVCLPEGTEFESLSVFDHTWLCVASLENHKQTQDPVTFQGWFVIRDL